MKTLSKLKIKDAHELSNDDMKRIEGGVSQGEYCRTLSSLYYSSGGGWSSGAWEGWWYGWSTYCR